MRKYVLATHGKMAEGMLTTIEMLAGTQENLTCINAYTDECPDPLPELKRIVEANSEAEIVIMTDLLGGSVNNNASALLSDPRIHVVAGVNLAAVIGILLSAEDQDTASVIESAVAEAKDMMVYCNTVNATYDDDDFYSVYYPKRTEKVYMIKSIRVDYRLLHGQVAVSWTASLGADCLLLVSDTVKNDPLRLNALKMAKPSGTKVVVKNTAEAVEALKSGVTDKYKLFIICETVEIAKAIIEATGEKTLNIGNIAYHENAKLYGRSAYMDAAELALVKEMVDDGVDVFIQMIPADKVIKCKSLF